MKKMLNEGNQTHNFVSSSGSGTVTNYGSGSDFLTSYGSGSPSQKVPVPMVPVPQRWPQLEVRTEDLRNKNQCHLLLTSCIAPTV